MLELLSELSNFEKKKLINQQIIKNINSTLKFDVLKSSF